MPDSNQPDWMHGSETELEVERLISASLVRYGDPSPDSDLARRILSQIATQPPHVATHRLLRWAVVLPIAACLIAAFSFFELRLVQAPNNLADRAQVVARPSNNSPVGLAHTPHRETPREKRPTVARNGAQREIAVVMAKEKAHPLPKLDVFPTPQPLTPAEKALLQFASSAPVSDDKPLIEAQRQVETPVTIVAIKIQPIELPVLGN